MDDFEFLHRIGAGSYAVVWQARRKSDGKYVAIKELKDTRLSWEQVLQMSEVIAAKNFKHENCLQIHSVLRLRRRVFIVMEYADLNLYQVMNSLSATGKRFTENQIVWIMKSILQGLSHIHEKGFMHRDLKPENVILFNAHSSLSNDPVVSSFLDHGTDASSTTAKICDFGQAKRVHGQNYNPMHPNSSYDGGHTQYVSTRWYRAPEVLLHSTDYNEAIDIWAAGILMAELYTFRPIFPGASESDQLYRIVSCLGSPTDSTWPQGMRLMRENRIQMPNIRSSGGIRTLIPSASPYALDLIAQMLQWNPSRRPSARSLLQSHPFFRSVPPMHVPVHNILVPNVSAHQQASYSQKRADAYEMQQLVEIDLEKVRRNAPPTPENAVSPIASSMPTSNRTAVDSTHAAGTSTMHEFASPKSSLFSLDAPLMEAQSSMEDLSFDFGFGEEDLQFGKLSLNSPTSHSETTKKSTGKPDKSDSTPSNPIQSQLSPSSVASVSTKQSSSANLYPSNPSASDALHDLEFEFDLENPAAPYPMHTSLSKQQASPAFTTAARIQPQLSPPNMKTDFASPNGDQTTSPLFDFELNLSFDSPRLLSSPPNSSNPQPSQPSPAIDVSYVSDDSESDADPWSIHSSHYYDPEQSEAVPPSITFSKKAPKLPPRAPPSSGSSRDGRRTGSMSRDASSSGSNTPVQHQDLDSSEEMDYFVSYVPNFARK